ncbi:MAG: glycoside hydrolase family 95 protein [Anaerocolumna sp.]
MDNYRLYEKTPASLFDDAHLLGNGSLGASVYGGVPYEQILINHDTLWSGRERDKISTGTKENLKLCRDMIMEGKLKEANDLINNEMLGYWSEAYQPLGNLYITMGHTGDLRSMKQRRILLNENPYEYENYSRILSLDDAVERIEYDQNGIHFTREMFVSHVDHILAIKLTAENGPMDFSLSMDSPLRHEQEIYDNAVAVIGRAPDRVEPYEPHFNPKIVYKQDAKSDALRFAAVAGITETDGEVTLDEFRIYVKGATHAVICLSADTNYAGYKVKRSRDARGVFEKCSRRIQDTREKSYENLMQEHIKDYQKLYGRFSIDLGDSLTGNLPTSERLELYNRIDDTTLPALILQYSRYLLIAFSRPGTQPGTLQGIWNPVMCSAWACNYTTNINVQMNYWGAESLGLSECHLPLMEFIKDLSESGRKSARELYGARGWVTHHNTDIWRMTELAGEDASWAWWVFGGIWLCQHLWQHYEFTKDIQFLKETVYPVLKGAVEFVLDFVTKDQNGTIVTAPSTSPENKFFLTSGYTEKEITRIKAENRFSANEINISAVCKASTMDLVMIRELMANYISAAQMLNRENEYETEIKETLEKLLPFQTGKYRQLQEWNEDYEECTPGMAHVSHLYSVYPASIINPADTPKLYEAARMSLVRRMQHGSTRHNWPGAWAICLNARFGDGALCNRINSEMAGGLGANLLVKGVLQIDAIMGWGAGISEMLLQSQNGSIQLLPAAAPSWINGKVKGICARGGFTVDMEWDNGKLSKAVISSQGGGHCDVRYKDFKADIYVPAGSSITLDDSLQQI